jgi:LmbE family N-acetylglucosaminyl deacetylase
MLGAVALLLGVAPAVGLLGRSAPARTTPPDAVPLTTQEMRIARVEPLALPPHPRVIVFAPHPDDETIAVGGLIHRLTHAGAAVRVVFVTNGDGFPRAVQADFEVPHPTDADYVAFGELRQREAIAAVARLGVPRREVQFLGFPDGGLAELWRAHWLPSHPYTSPYTKENRSLDLEGVGYDGLDLTSVLERQLRTFRPSVVIMPHPYDVHLDHAHTTYFVTEALTRLQESGALPSHIAVLTYLVHYPTWPAIGVPPSERIHPLAQVPDTVWSDAELTPAELEAKRAALAEYRSQLEVMGGFLRAFLCRNELFTTIDAHVLDRISSIH